MSVRLFPGCETPARACVFVCICLSVFLCPVFFSFFLHTSVNGFFLSKHGYVVSENVGDEGGFFFFLADFLFYFLRMRWFIGVQFFQDQ